MKKFGPVFRKIRLERGYSLKSITDGIVTISFLSKFERGESDITLTNFYALLERLNISLTEFTLISNDFVPTYFESLLDRVQKAYENNNIAYLESIASEELTKWELSQQKFHKYDNIMIKALIHNLDKQKPLSKEDKQCLCEYLLSIENWSIYELSLFGNSLNSLPQKTIVTLSKELISRSQLFIRLKRNKVEVIRILLNTIVICLENDNRADALYFITVVDNNLSNTNFYVEKTKLLFLKGVYNVISGELERGKMLAEKALYFMEELDSELIALTHKKYLENVLC